MGVPGLFASIVKNYNKIDRKIIKQKIDNDLPNHLYLDFNGGIYQVLRDEIKTEEALIIHAVDYLETLCKIIPNLELIYIAIDGVCPRAKMEQQRQRRFHSVCRKNRSTKINEQFGTELDKSSVNNSIDTNMITPGTRFMSKLSEAIKERISGRDDSSDSGFFKNKNKNKNNNKNNNNNIHIIFSDASIPQEGEHKLLHHIKEAARLAIDGTEKEQVLYGTEHNTIIYGLDGDLIYLSLTTHIPNIYLFREAAEYGNFAVIHSGKPYLFMDMTILQDAIIQNFSVYCGNVDSTKIDQYIDDYVFLGMILGNDFMPKQHWFSIHEGGSDKLLSAYFQIHNHTEKFLINRQSMQINTEMLCDLWFIIKEQEKEAIGNLFEKRKKLRIRVKEDMSERERQQLLTDMYPLQHLYVEQEIQPFKAGWSERYYKICFNMDTSNHENNNKNIEMITQTYLKTLVWNFLYYFDECPSWDWYYPYAYSPTFSDIYNELIKHKNINITSTGKIFQFGKTAPVEQQTLLFMVLPFASRKLMVGDAARQLETEKCTMNIYFPKKYGLNVAFHRYYYECSPIIYKLDLMKVKKFLKECSFTEDEKKRNMVGELFVVG
jgi:5'-3' exonuclease